MHKNGAENFAGQKRAKIAKRTRKSLKKAKPGAFWVLERMGTGEDGCKRMRKPTVRTSVNTSTIQHMQKENRQKRSVSAGFVAGAEGLEPSARGFGVDVGERTREREKADVIRFPPQVPERAVLVWCCELFLEKDCVSTTTSSFERKAPPPGGWPS